MDLGLNEAELVFNRWVVDGLATESRQNLAAFIVALFGNQIAWGLGDEERGDERQANRD